MTQENIRTEIFHMRAQLRSVDIKLKELSTALLGLAPAQDSENILDHDSEHYRESDFWDEPTTPLELANRMRAKQTTGEVWLAAFRITAKKVKYRAIYSLNPINPISITRTVSDQFTTDVQSLFLTVPTTNPSIIRGAKSSAYKSDNPADVMICLKEFGMEGLIQVPTTEEVEG